MPSIDDPATWHEYSQPDQELQQMMKQGITPKFTRENKISAIAPTREIWSAQYRKDALTALEAVKQYVTWEEISIPLRDKMHTRAIAFRPSLPPQEGSALVVLIHGGGFCFGTAEMEAPACIQSVVTHGCVCISLDYRLAPEYKYPTAFEDCWDSIKWISANAQKFGANLSRGFILGGTSAGGQITAALAHRSRDEGMPTPFTGIYLNVPGLLDPEAVPEKWRSMYRSRSQNGNGILLNSSSVAMYDEALEPDKSSTLWSSLNWPTGHANLPPTYFQVCGGDILRDEALIYERILRLDHGIKTKVDMYPGLPHVFWVNYPQHPASEQFLKDTVAGIGWLLKQN